MRIKAEIEWEDNGEIADVIFETEELINDDNVFFYGYTPKTGESPEGDWTVMKVYGEVTTHNCPNCGGHYVKS